jgi:hypothetical protein
MIIRLLALAGLATALTVTALPAAAAKKPFAQCMTDDGYGRYRPCDANYKQKHQK